MTGCPPGRFLREVCFLLVATSLVACGPAQPEREPASALPEVLPRVAEVGSRSWTVPVTEGTPILEYPFAPPDDRTGPAIELVEDLRLGASGPDPSLLLNAPSDIAVDGQGRIYVSDGGDDRVIVFDSEGRYLRTLGTHGQGPGEYDWPTALAIVGDSLAVSDEYHRTITVWGLDGELRSEHSFECRCQVFYMFGASSGSVIGGFRLWESPFRLAIARIGLDGKEQLRYGSLVEWQPPGISRRSGKNTLSAYLPVATSQPWFVANPDGDIYLTGGDEYQVLALGPSGETRWALRVPWPREPVTQEEIEASLEPHRRQFSDETLAGVRWPEIRPALAGFPKFRQHDRPLQLDGHGHLYVFPYFPMAWLRDDRLRPVDVYSSDGSLIFSGMMPNRDWVTAHGDHVYGIQEEAEGNYVVLRHRLIAPF